MRYIGILLILLCVLSCQNSNVSNSSFEDLEDGYYPKGRIPEWVKETLSEDGYKILQQLSQNYEMTYYKLSPQTKGDSDTLRQKKNKATIDFLLNYDVLETPRLKTKAEGDIDYGWSGNLGGTPIGGGYDTGQGLGGGSIEDTDWDFGGQTHVFWREFYNLHDLYAKISISYKYNTKTKKATELKGIYINIDKYGLSLNLSWEERGSCAEIINDGDDLKVFIYGRIKAEIEIEGLVGSDLIVENFYKNIEYEVNPGYDG